MKLTALSFLFFLFSISSGLAQMKLTPGETFLTGTVMKKVFVSVDDHTVWGLNTDGKVYYKKEADPDFQVYPQTAGLVVTDITGFSDGEMYFLTSPVVITFKDGVKTEIPVPFPGVTRINSISVVHVKLLLNPVDNPNLPNKDWLAIATNKDMYMLDRGKTTGLRKYQYDNQPIVSEPDWQITNTGFNTVDFRYKYPSGRCFEADYATMSSMDDLLYSTILPDKGLYPAINCTLFGNQYFMPFVGNSDYRSLLNFWGTNDGLYIKNAEACYAGLILKKVIPSEVINDLDEIYALTPIYKQNYVLAATNHGLYYTPASVYHELYGQTDIGKINFIPLTAINEKVNGICVDTKVYASIQVGVQFTYSSICQKVVWLATEKGIKKLYVGLDQDYYKNFLFSDLNFSASKTNSDDNTAVFETCGDQTITASIRIPDQFKNQLLIQWFKDGIEKEDWVGKIAVTMKDAGTYQAKITALCEGISLSTIPIIIKNNTDPEITFNYPPEINICESSSFTFNTDSHPGYTYKWFKNDLEIAGQANNYYVARSAGTYRVEVSNCAGYYKSSAPVKVNIEILPRPVITADKQEYCKGEAAILTVNNPEAFHIKWYLNEIEQPDLADHTTITAVTQGSYRAAFENSTYCSKTSAVFSFNPHDIPEALITRSSNRSLCYGETVNLSTATLNGAVYRWNTGETTPTITVRTTGIYFVEVTSEFGCTKKSSEINIVVRDPLLLDKPEDVKICTITGEQVRLSAEPGYVFYTWNGHRGNDFLDVNTPGQYALEVEDANGCKANTIFIVLPWCKEVVMPNTFSPNGDGTNDFWTVGGLENDPGATIRIYTRNGSLVFEGRGSKPVWDGRYKGSDLPVGVYYYLISTRNSLKPLTGWVTIIR